MKIQLEISSMMVLFLGAVHQGSAEEVFDVLFSSSGEPLTMAEVKSAVSRNVKGMWTELGQKLRGEPGDPGADGLPGIPGDCPCDDYLGFCGKKFKIILSMQTNWASALRGCHRMDMELATIRSDEEYTQFQYQVTSGGLGGIRIWLGAASPQNTTVAGRNWYWFNDGAPLTYVKYPGVLPVFGYNTALVSIGTTWSTASMTENNIFACEKLLCEQED